MTNIFPNALKNINEQYDYDRNTNVYSNIDYRKNNNTNYRVYPYCKRDDNLWGPMIKQEKCISLPNRLLNQGNNIIFIIIINIYIIIIFIISSSLRSSL